MTLPHNCRRLIRMGQALYGERWQNAVAKVLGVAHKDVWRWAKGQYEPSDERIEQLKAIARDRARKIMEVCGGD